MLRVEVGARTWRARTLSRSATLSRALAVTLTLSLNSALPSHSFGPRPTRAPTAAMLAMRALPRRTGRTRRDVAIDQHRRVGVLALRGQLSLRPRLTLLSWRTRAPRLSLVSRLTLRPWRTRLPRHAGLTL